MKTKAQDQEAGTTGISVRLPNDMLAQIDRLANVERRTRGNAIRLLLEQALHQRSERATEPLFPEFSCEICGSTMTKVSDKEAVCTRDDRHRRKLTPRRTSL